MLYLSEIFPLFLESVTVGFALSRNLLQEHAKLVVEENTIVMQEIDLKDRKIDEMQEDFDLQGVCLTTFRSIHGCSMLLYKYIYHNIL